MASVDDVRRELLEEFAGLHGEDAGFIDACAAIGALLSGDQGPGRIDGALGKLEALMFQVVDGRLKDDVRGQFPDPERKKLIGNTAAGGAFAPKTSSERKEVVKQTAPMTKLNADPFRKVLTTALDQFESNLNYPVNRDAAFHPRYVGLVSPERFLGNIAQGQHWKDVGASPDHGEFTHRLQWFVIAASDTVPPNKVAEVYRGIGLCRRNARAEDGLGQSALWARLCDRPIERLSNGKPGGTVGIADYRSPENFNTYLRAQAVRFPLLSSFLSARHAKRSGGGDSGGFPSYAMMKNYCAKKLYKRAYAELKLGEQAEVDKIVGERGSSVLRVQ